MLRFDRKQQKSVKQLSLNKKNKLKKKKLAMLMSLETLVISMMELASTKLLPGRHQNVRQETPFNK